MEPQASQVMCVTSQSPALLKVDGLRPTQACTVIRIHADTFLVLNDGGYTLPTHI